jgi:hypothetical protein
MAAMEVKGRLRKSRSDPDPDAVPKGASAGVINVT